MKHQIMRNILITMGFVLTMLGGQVAYALTVIPADCTSAYPCWSGSSPNNPDADDVSSITGTPDLNEVYKQNVGGSETGGFASSYETTFANTALDPEDATISWVGPDTISCPTCYLLLKDGNQDPIWYIFDISGWDGEEVLVMNDFWPGQGAISHVSIYSNPAPGPLLVMAIGLVGMIALRRRTMKNG